MCYKVIASYRAIPLLCQVNVAYVICFHQSLPNLLTEASKKSQEVNFLETRLKRHGMNLGNDIITSIILNRVLQLRKSLAYFCSACRFKRKNNHLCKVVKWQVFDLYLWTEQSIVSRSTWIWKACGFSVNLNGFSDRFMTGGTHQLRVN